MNSKAPPVPADNLSPKGTGENDHSGTAAKGRTAAAGNTAKQGQQGNAHVNTTHQGHQQDR
jgi:hypothetical protein